MAYDLFFRKQIPVNFSAHPTAEKSINPQTTMALVTLGVAFLESLLKKGVHVAEAHHYQQLMRPGHRPTVEVLAVPMHELVREFNSASD